MPERTLKIDPLLKTQKIPWTLFATVTVLETNVKDFAISSILAARFSMGIEHVESRVKSE
jgi:hypothetical protein